jgi:hypothetical protein
MRRLIAPGVTWLIFAVAASAALALPIQVSSPAALSPNDAVNWAQLAETDNPFGSPLDVISNSGMPVIASGGLGFNRLTEGVSWLGNFTGGDAVLWTSVDGTDDTTSPMLVLTFASAVQGLGASIQPNYYGPFTATLEVFSGSASLGLFVVLGDSTDEQDGSAPYLGALDAAATITSVVFSITFPPQDCTDLDLNCGLAINQLDLRLAQVTAVSEPGTLSLLLSALVGIHLIGGAIRRRRLQEHR